MNVDWKRYCELKNELVGAALKEYYAAEEDYKRKKRAKGEPIDMDKMRNAINKRKRIMENNDKLLFAQMLPAAQTNPAIMNMCKQLMRSDKLKEAKSGN